MSNIFTLLSNKNFHFVASKMWRIFIPLKEMHPILIQGSWNNYFLKRGNLLVGYVVYIYFSFQQTFSFCGKMWRLFIPIKEMRPIIMKEL